jgi:hypothetical protein
MYRKSFLSKTLFSSLFIGVVGVSFGQVSSTSGKSATPKRGISLLAPDSNKTDFLNSIKVSGDARFYTIYRDMSKQYGDQVTASKNLDFLAYPNSGGGNAAGKPFVEFAITAKPSAKSEVSLGYALAHTFTGQQGDTARFAQIRNLINFGGKVSTPYGLYALQTGGGVLWTTLSPLTMSNPEFRADNFDRLEWDWYTNSWSKYKDFYNASAGIGSQNYGAIGLQGFKFSGSGLPANFGFDAMYGRTNQSVDLSKVASNPPSYVFGGRLSKGFGGTLAGLNYYTQDGYTDNINSLRDYQQIITGDLKTSYKDIKFYTELGLGRISNPSIESDGFGKALILRASIPEEKLGLPINAQLFSISHDVVSNVSSALNTNVNAPNGGFGRDLNYATALFVNVLQETGQLTNNRMGTSLITGKQIKDLKIEFGLGLSQEIENLYDTITVQHRANNFSRSRFNPWYQVAGPYQRVKNIFRRSFEFVSITDGSKDYKKGFSTIDLSLNYKTRLLRKEVIFKLYQTYGSIQEGILPKFTDKAFMRQWYAQAITFLKMNDKVCLVAFYEKERNVANLRTTLSSYNNKPMNQVGDGFGYGVDYDFSSYAGVFFRHRFMYNQDLNFVKDSFQGQELTLELKVFF